MGMARVLKPAVSMRRGGPVQPGLGMARALKPAVSTRLGGLVLAALIRRLIYSLAPGKLALQDSVQARLYHVWATAAGGAGLEPTSLALHAPGCYPQSIPRSRSRDSSWGFPEPRELMPGEEGPLLAAV